MHIRYLANEVTSYAYIVIFIADDIHTFFIKGTKKHTKKHTLKSGCVLYSKFPELTYPMDYMEPVLPLFL